jgi:hypothetical protein
MRTNLDLNEVHQRVQAICAWAKKATMSDEAGPYRDALTAEGQRLSELEDQLYLDVLATIASGSCPDPQQLARAALEASEVKFNRWRS